MATIRDVARQAGVSRSTVSLVINKSPLVKDETRLHVLRVIEGMKYVPNNNARGLSNKITNNLGIIFMQEHAINSTATRSYDFEHHTGMTSQDISYGIMSKLADTDYGAVMEYFCSVDNPDDIPRIIKTKRVDGAMIVGSPYSQKMIENFQEIGLPFVMVGINSFEEEVDSIMTDPGAGVNISVEHLYEYGHSRLCFVNCPRSYRSFYTRKDALEQTVNRLNLDFDPLWLMECKKNDGQSGYETFKNFWAAGNRPDSIITANANIALGVMRYLYEQKVRVPEDISIIAYEDSALCGYSAPALTSINIQKDLMGQKAAECLLSRIKEPDREPERITISPFLVRRDSVANRK